MTAKRKASSSRARKNFCCNPKREKTEVTKVIEKLTRGQRDVMWDAGFHMGGISSTQDPMLSSSNKRTIGSLQKKGLLTGGRFPKLTPLGRSVAKRTYALGLSYQKLKRTISERKRDKARGNPTKANPSHSRAGQRKAKPLKLGQASRGSVAYRGETILLRHLSVDARPWEAHYRLPGLSRVFVVAGGSKSEVTRLAKQKIDRRLSQKRKASSSRARKNFCCNPTKATTGTLRGWKWRVIKTNVGWRGQVLAATPTSCLVIGRPAPTKAKAIAKIKRWIGGKGKAPDTRGCRWPSNVGNIAAAQGIRRNPMLHMDPPELKRVNKRYIWKDDYGTQKVKIVKESFPGRSDIPLGAIWYVVDEDGSNVDKLEAPPRGHPDRRKLAAKIRALGGAPKSKGTFSVTKAELQARIKQRKPRKPKGRLRSGLSEATRRLKRAGRALAGKPNPAKIRTLTRL
jgi:hypothetical protein